MKNIFLSFVFLLVSTNLYSGSPRELTFFVRPLPAGEDIKYIIDGFFMNYYGMNNPKTPSCEPDNYTPHIRRASLSSLLPEGLSKTHLVNAVNSSDIRKKVSEIVSRMKYKDIVGFDGVMLYEMKNNIVTIYTFAVRNYDKIFTTTIEANLLASDKHLGHAICSSISDKTLSYFEP